ncbi:Serpentine receptor class r-10 [Caenorhabditis elegans]|uniref:Serpentine receptor class r-10 n=1 Tax=Caenorhabditis elegans TaxID=6239 RepID=Q9XUJ6_CAEEL|nr:Seven TM Receptor [Caenorhabditis elegans]CAB04942.2 Seven TM Receptor [Caenorhabditis elegans]|eukprot:NP_499425.2 Seven TM Receptor [Caenorhabditis elegans]
MQIDDAILLNISAFCAVSINFLLILLILTKSPKSLGSYKFLMIYINLFEFTYAILYCAEKPDLFTKESAFFLIVNWKESLFPKFIACILDLLFVGFFGISIAILALHFVYRFLSMTNNHHVKSFDSWKIILWFMIPLLNGVTFMVTGGIILCADRETDRFMSENYPELVDDTTNITDLYYMGAFFWPKLENSQTEKYFSWKGAEGSIIVMGLIGLSSSIMVYFGVKGYRSMNKLISQTTCSLKFKSVQQQLFHALVFQTLIPVFLMHIPASAIYITIFFGKSSEIVGQTLSLTIAMYPALNPLPTIFIVKNYRKAVKEVLMGFQNKITGKQRVSQITSTAFSTQSARQTNQ